LNVEKSITSRVADISSKLLILLPSRIQNVLCPTKIFRLLFPC
jgi:hypothetical protein